MRIRSITIYRIDESDLFTRSFLYYRRIHRQIHIGIGRYIYNIEW